MAALVTGTDPWDPNYGCFVTDWGCHAQQTIGAVFASTIRNLGDFIATLIGLAFNGSISHNGWAIAHSQFLFWVEVMAPIVILIAMVQVGIAMIMQDWSRIGRTAIGATIAIPFSALGVWAMQEATSVTDGVTNNLTTAIQGGDLAEGLLRAVGIVATPSTGAANAIVNSQFAQGSLVYGLAKSGAQNANGIGEYVIALFIVAFAMVGALFLCIAMAIRDFGLLALAATAPIGLMMIGQPKLAVWAQRWASMTTGLLLAKPLSASVILLAVELSTDNSADLVGVLVAIGAMFAAAFSPLWATKLVSFAGAEVGNALQKRASVREQVSRGQTAAAPVRGTVRLARVGR